jgi:hypothetical protein
MRETTELGLLETTAELVDVLTTGGRVIEIAACDITVV